MKQPLRVGILAGELSGDMLGAGLMSALREKHADIRFEGIGGELMTAQGLDSQVPMDRLSVMGLVEPLRRLPELLRIRADLFRHFRADPPDVFVGIDSPDFCLGLEEKLRQCGIPTVHYVSPSVWAWRRRRIRRIARAVDLMLTLFPFEAAFYEQHGVPVRFVGHPLADQIPEQTDVPAARRLLGIAENSEVLALLPGSRHGEVARLAPPFLAAAGLLQQQRPGLEVLIPAASPARREQLEQLLAAGPALKARVIDGQARTVLAAADRVLIASGTATLEALLMKKPMVVCYRMATLSHAIISRMLKVSSFSLPNLLAGEKLVPELLQNEVEPDNLLKALLRQEDNQAVLEARFTDIHRLLRRDASREAADAILELICPAETHHAS